MKPLGRRQFLKGIIAGTAVVGLNLKLNRWVAHASEMADTVPIPPLDGELIFAPDTRSEAADDFGHIVSHTPMAVLYPGSVADVAAMVRYANEQGVGIGGMGMVGDSHSTYGQAQVPAGIVVNMASLSEIHEINTSDALVDAGVRWRDLVAAAFVRGKSPPTLTDYTGLSIGGTLSVGGIGGQAHQEGLMVDNVLELHVVTGTGELMVCSRHAHRDLFDAVRGGMGQFGIIVRARVRLREVPPMVRVYRLIYRDVGRFTADQEMLVRAELFDYIEGEVIEADGGGWCFRLEAAKYFAPGSPPDDGRMLHRLSFERGSELIEDQRYLDFILRLDPVVDGLKEIGAWSLPHPWLNLFLPAHVTPWLVHRVLAQTSTADMGGGPILLYPFRKSVIHARYPVLPGGGDICYLFSLLRTAVPGTPAQVSRLVDENRAIFELVRSYGGTIYPISAVPMTLWDWRFHLWPWFDFVANKRRFDPGQVLAPGLNIFPRSWASPAGSADEPSGTWAGGPSVGEDPQRNGNMSKNR